MEDASILFGDDDSGDDPSGDSKDGDPDADPDPRGDGRRGRRIRAADRGRQALFGKEGQGERERRALPGQDGDRLGEVFVALGLNKDLVRSGKNGSFRRNGLPRSGRG